MAVIAAKTRQVQSLNNIDLPFIDSLSDLDLITFEACPLPNVVSSLNLRINQRTFWRMSSLQKVSHSYGYAFFLGLDLSQNLLPPYPLFKRQHDALETSMVCPTPQGSGFNKPTSK